MRRTSARPALPALLLVLAFVAGCTPSAGKEPARSGVELTALVRAYNVRLAEGFRDLDMNRLNTVATKDQATTEYYQMSALGESKVKLLATPRKIDFLAVRFSSDTSATVDTQETWDYVQVSTETNAVVRKESGVSYRLRYGIVRQKGRWLVDTVDEVATSSPPVSGD